MTGGNMALKKYVPILVICLLACSLTNNAESNAHRSANSLIIPMEHVTIIIDEMSGSPQLKKDSVDTLDTIKFDLGYTQIEGNINNKILHIVDNQADSIIIQEKYCTNIFFNEDGSGSVYTLKNVEESCTDWTRLSPIESDKYCTSKMKKTDPSFPKANEKAIALAEKHIAEKKKNVPVGYKVKLSTACYRISTYSKKQGWKEKTIEFNVHYGD